MATTLFPLPDPFAGYSTKIAVEHWIESFTDAYTHLGVDDATGIKLLRARLSDDAFEWFIEMRDANPDWKLNQFLTGLKERFASFTKPKTMCTLQGLESLPLKREEPIIQFVRRFSEYATKIPSDRKTEALLQEVFLRRMLKIDPTLTQRIVKPPDTLGGVPEATLSALIALFVKNSVPDADYWKRIETSALTSETGPSKEVDKLGVSGLREDLRKLTIAVEKSTARRPSGPFQQNSNYENSHEYRPARVPEPTSRKAFIGGRPGTTTTADSTGKEAPPAAPEPIVNIISAEPTTLVLPASKRTRVEGLPSVQDILTNNLNRPIAPPKPAPRTGLKPPVVSQVKKRPTPAPTPVKHLDLIDRFLQAPVPIKAREYLADNPSFAKSLRKQLRVFEKTRKPRPKTMMAEFDDQSEISDSSTDSSDLDGEVRSLPLHSQAMKKYIVGNVNGNPVPQLLDNGSDYSVMSAAFVRSFGLAAIPLESPWSFQNANSESMKVEFYVLANVAYAPDFIVPIKFYVLDRCPAAMLVGLCDQQSLQAEINYGVETCTLYHDGRKVELQLCSFEQLHGAFDMSVSDSPATMLVSAGDLMSRVEDEWEALSDLRSPDLASTLKRLDPKLSGEQRQEFAGLLHEYSDLFPSGIRDLKGIREFEYSIELEEGANRRPVSCRLRRYAPHETEAIRAELDMMLAASIVRPSKSPWTSPVVLVPKKDGRVRFCVNYRKLNDLTTSDKFPLPRIEDCLDSLQGKKYFSTLDCMSGYWQVRMEEKSSKLTAFITPFGVYEFIVMPFGLKNAPAAFSRIMSRLLAESLYDFVTIYLDDIAVYSLTFKEHMGHLRHVFERCREYGVCLKLEKCMFLTTNFRYLGYLVSEKGILPDPEKVAVLESSPAPTNLKSLRSFLGLASYFRRFIPSFTDATAPLVVLLKKGQKYIWDEACQEAFDLVRRLLAEAPVLKLPDYQHQFVLSTDASNVAIGALLEQYDESAVLRPICFASRSLSPAERNYTVHEREALALVTFVRKFRCYLFGTRFVAYTDNSAILSLLRQKEPPGRISRWSMQLLEYDYELRHRAGKNNPVADFLSRPNCLAISAETERSHQITFKDIRKYLLGQDMEGMTTDSRFRRATRRYEVKMGQLYRKTKDASVLVVETAEELIRILEVLHDQLGHQGIPTVWSWVQPRFWRPYLYREVQAFISSCTGCQQYQLRKPSYPFDGQSAISGIGWWSVDILGPLPAMQEYRSILVGVEHLSGFVVADPLRSETAKEVVVRMQCFVSRFGIPTRLSTDNGPCFTAQLFKSFCRDLNIEHEEVVAYQPEWQGMVERAIGLIRYSLMRSTGPIMKDWPIHLPRTVFGLNARISSRTGHSPYYLMFGIQPKLPIDATNLPLSHEGRQIELTILPGVRAACFRPSLPSSTVRKFPVNSLVGVLSPQFRKGSSVRDKKTPRYVGPYKVLEADQHHVYRLESESGEILSVHASRLVVWFNRCVSLGGGSVIRPYGSNGRGAPGLLSTPQDVSEGVEEHSPLHLSERLSS
jgi:transposase InsO family protein